MSDRTISEAAEPPVSMQTSMDEWVALFATRDDLAVEYAELLKTKVPTSPTWAVLNLAIVNRWSKSGLNYVKVSAWNAIARERGGSIPSTYTGDLVASEVSPSPDSSPDVE